MVLLTIAVPTPLSVCVKVKKSAEELRARQTFLVVRGDMLQKLPLALEPFIDTEPAVVATGCAPRSYMLFEYLLILNVLLAVELSFCSDAV